MSGGPRERSQFFGTKSTNIREHFARNRQVSSLSINRFHDRFAVNSLHELISVFDDVSSCFAISGQSFGQKSISIQVNYPANSTFWSSRSTNGMDDPGSTEDDP